MLEVTMAMLADAANVSREGKLNILGVFENINAHVFPTVHPNMSLVMIMEADRADTGRDIPLRIQLIDADGKVLISIDGGIKVSHLQSGRSRAKINHVLNFSNVQFPTPGAYEIKIIINNEVRRSVPLSVVQVPQAKSPQE